MLWLLLEDLFQDCSTFSSVGCIRLPLDAEAMSAARAVVLTSLMRFFSLKLVKSREGSSQISHFGVC